MTAACLAAGFVRVRFSIKNLCVRLRQYGQRDAAWLAGKWRCAGPVSRH